MSLAMFTRVTVSVLTFSPSSIFAPSATSFGLSVFAVGAIFFSELKHKIHDIDSPNHHFKYKEY